MNIVKKISSWYFSREAVPHWCVLLLDCAIVVLASYIGALMQRGVGSVLELFRPITLGILISLVFYGIAFRCFHTYVGIVRYSSFVDLQRVAYATFSGALVSWLLYLLAGSAGISVAVFPDLVAATVIFLVSTVLMFMMRVAVKVLFDSARKDENTLRAFIYGIREGGVSIAKGLNTETPVKYSLAGFVAPEGDMDAEYLMGVKVYEDKAGLVEKMNDAKAAVLFVSPLQADHFRDRADLINELVDAGIKIMIMQPGEEWDGTSPISHRQLHDIDIEDLLPRDKIEVDMDAIGEMLTGKRILITGAAGSIGSEMVRQVAKFGPADLILVDQAETPMHDVRRYMARKYPSLNVSTIVSSIANQEHMERIFAAHKPEYVFHAAAYKHVPMMEDNPAIAVQNNVYGTRVIADLAVKYGAKKFVMISTDKAVNPTNVMGCSKRICEIYCQALSNKLRDENAGTGKEGTQFITTRFGNVLGSNGSVVPIFKEQIAKGGPVQVTHPDIIRYFMLISEACKLVLEAGTMGKGGEIFVFDMGKPVKIVELAKRMIKLSGAQDIEIKFTGLRDGEKLYEEVLSDAEKTVPTVHPKIHVAAVREYPYDLALRNETELLEISNSFDDMAIVAKMKAIVPEYKSQHSKYEALDK